jgi:transcriptional regulator with XRE-family HTH domain
VSPRSFKPDPSLAALGEAVKTLRREQGLTQALLAKRAGIAVTYVGRIEKGERNLTWSALKRLCHGLGVQTSALLARVENAEPSEKESTP